MEASGQADIPEGLKRELVKQAARKETLTQEYGELLDRFDGVLEIGCGHGHWLTAYAMENPTTPCIGIDIHGARIHKACTKADKRRLKHLHFIKAEAGEFLEILPKSAQLQKVIILFPDPWPKKRHYKNRLIQHPFLSQVANFMAEHGKLYFRTDHENYFAWSTEIITGHPSWIIDNPTEWPMENTTFFQDLMSSYQSLSATVKK